MNKILKLSMLALIATFSLAACSNKTPDTSSTPITPSSLDGTTAKETEASAESDKSSSFKSQVEKDSYAVGIVMGGSVKQLKDLGFEVDMKAFFNAVQSVYDGKQTKLSEPEASTALMGIMEELHYKANKKYEEEAQANKEKGKAFLKENATKEGVKTTASGLQYKMIKEGTGRQPRKNDLVHIGYEGRLIDGTVFDSSKDGVSDDGVGEYSIVPVGQIIKGLGEGLQLLKEGGEATFYIPAKLAYGEEKVGNKIGPNSVLIFDVKLVKIDRNGKHRIR
ncbi:FKBP-type peptidyl-prolyl cis-trans isomerase N-terminal domain-containing protein [Neisseria sicca]